MKEDLVKAVMAAYFKQKNIDAQPTGRGEKGPDFHIDGAAVEVKGVGLDYERLFEQLVTYAYREREIHLALPVEALTAEGLVQLYVLERVIQEMRGKTIKLYLIKEQDDYYYVRDYYNVGQVLPYGISNPDPLILLARAETKAMEGLRDRRLPEAEARKIAKSVRGRIRGIDAVVVELLGKVVTKMEQPYPTMVHKSNVKLRS